MVTTHRHHPRPVTAYASAVQTAQALLRSPAPQSMPSALTKPQRRQVEKRGETERLGRSWHSLAFPGSAGGEGGGKREIPRTLHIGRKAKLFSCFALCFKDQPDSAEPCASGFSDYHESGFPTPDPPVEEGIDGKMGPIFSGESVPVQKAFS